MRVVYQSDQLYYSSIGNYILIYKNLSSGQFIYLCMYWIKLFTFKLILIFYSKILIIINVFWL